MEPTAPAAKAIPPLQRGEEIGRRQSPVAELFEEPVNLGRIEAHGRLLAHPVVHARNGRRAHQPVGAHDAANAQSRLAQGDHAGVGVDGQMLGHRADEGTLAHRVDERGGRGRFGDDLRDDLTLAERSADATRQIASLVKAIQTDTQDAVAAMERSTQGVVEGARLSDNAGTALSEIDSVSRRLAELIERISASASKEAQQANEVARNIQHIFAVTEQTGEGTRSTVAQVRDLTRMADELRQSVARFKIA